MSDSAARYRKVAGEFRERVEAVPADAWDNPAPCEGWVARDVIRHLVDWLPAHFFATWGIEHTPGPSVDDDPVGAWAAVDASIQAALDDPAIARAERESGPMGSMTFEASIDMICTPDVLIHTWDLARATGLDETLDADEVRGLAAAMEPMDQMLRESGHFGPRVEVADDADEQTKLIAFTGRQP
jgi:uncharacterized protein (TIGR03086 family)